MPLYEFLCKRGHITEELVPTGRRRIPCPVCMPDLLGLRTDAKRILSPTVGIVRNPAVPKRERG